MEKDVYLTAANDYLEFYQMYSEICHQGFDKVIRFFNRKGMLKRISFLYRIDYKSISLYIKEINGQAKIGDSFIVWQEYEAIYGMTLEKCLSYH